MAHIIEKKVWDLEVGDVEIHLRAGKNVRHTVTKAPSFKGSGFYVYELDGKPARHNGMYNGGTVCVEVNA